MIQKFPLSDVWNNCDAGVQVLSTHRLLQKENPHRAHVCAMLCECLVGGGVAHLSHTCITSLHTSGGAHC